VDYVNVDISGYVHDDDDGDDTHLRLLSSVLPVLDCKTFHSINQSINVYSSNQPNLIFQ
jgi:hypothetical protein